MRREKVRKDRLAVLLVLCAVVITTTGFGIRKTSDMPFHDPYETYKAYGTKGKNYGDIQQVNKEYESEAFVSSTYSVYEERELNSPIKTYEKKAVPTAGKTKKQITSIDYDSSLLLDRYVNLAFHRHTYNINDMQTHIETTWMLYDKRQKKQLVLEDALRREYPVSVKRLAGEQGWKKNTKRDTNALSMIKTSLCIHPDEKHAVSVLYKEYRKYIRLKDSHIPSLYQKDTAVTRVQLKIDPKEKMIAFTFDGRPSAYTLEVMGIFERYDGRTTFFMLGQNVEANRNTAKEMCNRGFELGDHSWDHFMDLAASRKRYMSASQVAENVYKVQGAIYAICGTEPQCFRPPYSAANNNMLKDNHLGYAFWDIDTRDWSSKNAASITAAVLNGAKDGSTVILFHDIYEPNVESLKSILPESKKQDYQFVIYSTLMEYEKDYLLKLDANCGVSGTYVNGYQICTLFAGLFSLFVLY